MKKKLFYFHYNPADCNCMGLIIMLLGIGMMIFAWSPYILVSSLFVIAFGLGGIIYATSRICYMEHVEYKVLLYNRMKRSNQMDIEIR